MQNTTTAEEEEKKKDRVKNLLKQFIPQLKQGCQKPYCFNEYCMKYYRGKWSFNKSIQHVFGADFIVFIFFVVVNERKKFANDRDLLTFALKELSSSNDPEGMICSPE